MLCSSVLEINSVLNPQPVRSEAREVNSATVE